MQKRTNKAAGLFDKYAEAYQEKYMNQQMYAAGLDEFCRAIKKDDARILELACGPGNITRYLLDKKPDWQILGIDLAPRMVDLARINNPTAQFEVMDCRDPLSLGVRFDGVMCGFAIPYLSKEESIRLIEGVGTILNSKGVFYLSTMEGNYEESQLEGPSSGGAEKIFIHYHEAEYLQKAMTDSGFEILNVLRIDQPDRQGPSSNDLVLIARK